MAGQGRTLMVLGGVLVVGIGAALFAMFGPSTDTAQSDDAPGKTAAPAAAADAHGKPAPAVGRRAKPKGSASVTGLVLRSKGKVPVPDQDVQLIPEKGDPWTVKTDVHGAFALVEIPHGGPYELRVAAPGCGTIRMPGMALDRNEKRDVGTLWLDPAVSVSVQVRAWSDQPVEGALVEAYSVAQADNFDWSKAYAQMGQAPVAVAKAKTDAQGAAVFPQLAVGRWTFTASKDGFARAGKSGVSVRSDVPPAPVKIYLGTGHSLSGRVFDAAKSAVSGAQVMAGPNANVWDIGGAPLRLRTTTDAQGHYEFASLESGDTTLFVGRPNGVPSPVATVRIPSVSTFDVTLKGTSTVTGAVTAKDGGKPIDGATVRAWSWSGAGQDIAEGTTDAEGKYSVVVSAGVVNMIQAEKDGWVSAEDQSRGQTQMQIREGETQTRDLKMRTASKITGVVKGPDGPVPGAKVSVQSGTQMTGWSQKTASTDAEGRYEVGSLTPGKAVVRAEAAGLYLKDFPDNPWMLMSQQGPSPFKVDLPEGAAAVKDLELVRGVAVEGRVDGPEGPLAGARVATQTDYEGGVVTAEGGAFKIEGVKPTANLVLYAIKDGYAASADNKPVAVSAESGATNVVLKMTKSGVVKGKVTAQDGGAIIDAKASIAGWFDNGQMDPRQMAMMRGGAGAMASATAPVLPDGTFELPLGAQPSGKFRVSVTAADRPTVNSDPQTIVDGQAEYVVNLTLDSGRDLAGTVVAKQGGAPVAGALVSVVQSQGKDARGMAYRSGGMASSGGNGQSVWAVTDAQGRFTVTHLASAVYSVSARADGYVQGAAQVDLATTSQVNVEIEQELTIEGAVTFADGAPVVGANISATRDNPGTQNPNANFGGGNAWGMTGIGGKFRLSGLVSGSYKLNVSPGWQSDLNIKSKQTDPIAAGTLDAKVVVDVGGLIAGHVLDPQKKGVASVWIYAYPEQKDGKQPQGAEQRQVMSKEDGSFSVGGLSDVATYMITVQPNQGWGAGAGSLKNVVLKGQVVGTTNLDVILEEGLTVTGTVVDADGKPVPNAYLYATSVTADGKGSRQSSYAMTDASGVFTLGGLDVGECTVTMQEMGGSGSGLVIQNGDKIPAGAKDVRLVASKGLTIVGTVVDDAGAPVGGAQISANAKAGAGGGARNRNARSNADGTFEVTGLSADAAYQLYVNAAGRPAARVENVAAGSTGVRVVLVKGLDASGTVVDESGAPVKQGVVWLQSSADPNQSASAQTDDSGAFKVSGLVEGTYTAKVFVRSQPDKGYRACGTLRAGDTAAQLKVLPQ